MNNKTNEGFVFVSFQALFLWGSAVRLLDTPHVLFRGPEEPMCAVGTPRRKTQGRRDAPPVRTRSKPDQARGLMAMIILAIILALGMSVPSNAQMKASPK